MSPKTVAAVIVGLLFGAAIGIGAFTFVYARGASYMTNDPQACANCHVMNTQFDGWVKSTHGKFAVCNDCHAPHDFFGKYTTKAINGFFHSYAFTTGDFPEPIRITERNRKVTEGACRHCHADTVAHIESVAAEREPLACLGCHPGVGHPETVTVGTTPWLLAGGSK